MRNFVCAGLAIALPMLCVGEKPSARTSAIVKLYALRYNVPQDLLFALIEVESNWNPRAISPKGALGLMQLMPDTARHFGAFNPFDPEQNIAAGTRYIALLMTEFKGDLRLVTAAYNAGDYWIGRKQLRYQNCDVVAYVRSVRQHYEQRRLLAATLPGGHQ